MTQNLLELPTMIEATSLKQLDELKNTYLKAKENKTIDFDTDFLLLRSKDNDFLAYFYNTRDNPTILDTVQWMQDNGNFTFPGNVSILNGVLARYDEIFHPRVQKAVKIVCDNFIHSFEVWDKLEKEHPEQYKKLLDFAYEFKEQNPPPKKKSIR